ncbi:oligosaccharide flippase family protein [Fluviicola taffensis]|uniref:Polysaccharide biosynthesis protein n=1 Tax=Fluviicola taffensis (strain DSM 16823 / NCIMB 13979 / RW262) TaxID=755732 RepID=F2IJ12_FLUTR|nr:oligosaccharide flippase family protein [Fluviicola taffensis]AEA43870.1 polysaccharide biosynthesis protein [Fluviicola taffensis DSM 16823]
MQKLFLKGLGITLLLNLLVKPATIFLVDIKMQNELGSATYGIFQTMLSFTFLFSMFLDMGITNFMTRMIAQHPHMIYKYSNRLFTFRLILVVIYVLWTVSLFFILQFPMQWFWVLSALIAHQISIITVNYVRAYTGGLLKFSLDAALSVAERSVYFIFGGILMYTTFIEPINLGWFVTAFVGSSAISLVIATFIYLKIVAFPKFHWDTDFFKAIFRQSYPYAILVILMMLTARLDAVFIEKLHPDGTNQVSYYTQSFRLLDACWMFAVLFGSILLPVFSRLLKENGSTTGIMTTALNILFSGGLLMVVFTIGIKETMFDMLYEDANAYSYYTWVFHSIAFIPMCFTVVFGTLLTANGSLRILNQIALLSLIVVCILNLVLVPFFGAIGAAIAFLVAQSILGVLQYFVVRYRMKHLLAKNTWLKLFILSLCLIAFMFAEIVFQWSILYYIVGLGLLWVVLVFGLKIIDLVQILSLLSKKEN